MSRSKRYVIDSTGNELTDTKDNSKIRVKEYEIKPSGKLQIVHIDTGEKTVKIARHNIDESAWPLGEPKPSSALGRMRADAERGQKTVPAPLQMGLPVGLALLTKEEAIELHLHAKALLDITHKLFMAHIVPLNSERGGA